MKADVFRARARNFPGALEASFFRDDVPVAVYDGLITAVRRSIPPLFRYYELRRRVLGLDELHPYDTYVPFVPEIETHITFDEAIERSSRRLRRSARNNACVGRRFARTLVRSLRNKRKTQRRLFLRQLRRAALHPDELQGGCFRRRLHTGPRSRALHAHLVPAKSQLFQDYDYPIFLAEVATTFNEELLTHFLLEETSDPKMRAYIINRQIDDIRGTLYRQTMFAEFEKMIHAIEEAGGALTLDVLKANIANCLRLILASRGHRSRTRSRMPADSAFLQRLLRLQIRHRNFRCGGSFPARS